MPVAIGNNPERSRSHNRRVVLEAVRLHGPLGRTDIARRAHLTAQAVSNIVGELLSEGLLVEHGRRRSGRGQPPIQFSVNPDGGMTAGIEIGTRQITTLLVDLAGTLRAQRSRDVGETDPESIIPLIGAELRAARAAIPGPQAALLGVGVVMPGPFGVDGMCSIGPTTLKGWIGLNAGALIEAEVLDQVFLENDATAAAVGERLHGVGRSLRNFCLIYFGQGLGLGIIIDGLPFRGAFGNAGEIGHNVVAPGGRACACGQSGCLEQYASLQSLQERLTCAGIPETDTGAITALHAAGHPVIQAWIEEAATYLRPQITVLENLLDPEAIVFGGMLPDALMGDLIQALAPLSLSVSSRRHRDTPRLIAGTTGGLTAALGAAALPLLDSVTPRLDVGPARGTPDRPLETSHHAE